MSGVGMTLSYDDLGIRAAIERVRDLGDSLRDSVFEPIGQALQTTTLERFQNSEGPDGEAWDVSFRASITGGKTLVETGSLRDSINYYAEDDAVEVGTADIRAPVHQFGAVIHAKTSAGLNFFLADGLKVVVDTVTIPERPFLGLSATDELVIVEITQDALGEPFGVSAR